MVLSMAVQAEEGIFQRISNKSLSKVVLLQSQIQNWKINKNVMSLLPGPALSPTQTLTSIDWINPSPCHTKPPSLKNYHMLYGFLNIRMKSPCTHGPKLKLRSYSKLSLSHIPLFPLVAVSMLGFHAVCHFCLPLTRHSRCLRNI